MTKIVLEQFAGEIPKIEPRYLPPQYGAEVSGARLTRGNLAPMRDDLTIHTLSAPASSIYLHGSTWLSWPGADVDVAPGPVATDRLYLTRSNGAPQMYSGGIFYDLALPGPTVAPTAALGALTRSFTLTANAQVARFTLTNSLWVRSSTSISTRVATSRTTATAGQILLADTTRASRRLVACLPRNPSTGTVVAIKTKGTGILTIHRNGQTIGNAATDLNIAPSERTLFFYFNGSTWIRTNVSDPRTIIRTETAVTIANGDNISVDSDKDVTITLPGPPYALGQLVFVERANRGAVTVRVSGTTTTIGTATTYSMAAKGDRVAFMHNGTFWRALRIGGAFDDELTRSTTHQTLDGGSAVEFMTSSAPKVVLIDMPTATSGQVAQIGAVGGGDAIILPNGLLIEGQSAVFEVDGVGDFITMTATGSGWDASASDVIGATSNESPNVGQTVIAYTARQRVTITLPDDATNGDVIDVVRLGPRNVVVDNMASDLLARSTVYAYTYVTSLGEESAPSPVSGEVMLAPGRTATVTMPSTHPSARLGSKKRIYRSVTTESGVTDLFFVAELAGNATTYTDSLSTNAQEAISTRDFDTPPATLRGLVSLPNGIMAGFSGREVYFCEPYIPHAWPAKYSQQVTADIVGLVALGSSLIVLTKQTPWRLDGLHPDSMSLTKIEANYPCLAKRGIVDMGYSAVYPSNDGLVQVSADGSASLITSALWDREQWRALAPDSFRAAQFIGRYAFSYDPLGTEGRRLAFLDLTGEMPFIIPVDNANYVDLHYAIETGRLIGLKADWVTIASIDDPGAGLRTAMWLSKPFMLPSFDTFSTVKIDATAPPAGVTPVFEFRVYTEGGAFLHTITEPNKFKRLPAKLSDEWSFRIVTNWTVQRAIIVGTADELIGG